MSKFSSKLIVIAVLLPASLSGCSSHLIRVSNYDGVGNYERESLSVGGSKGASSDGPGFVAKKCDSADGKAAGKLMEVEVSRDFGDTLVSLLTFGIVTPATIRYQCSKPVIPPPPPPCDCENDGNEL